MSQQQEIPPYATDVVEKFVGTECPQNHCNGELVKGEYKGSPSANCPECGTPIARSLDL